MNIAICDDDPAARQIVEGAIDHYLKRRDMTIRTFLFSSSYELEEAMRSQSFEVILLDIEMPLRDGISFARKLREEGSDQAIIFLSNMEHLVFEAMKVQPYGFIRKKNFFEDIVSVLGSFLDSRKKDELYFVPEGQGREQFSYERIVYIESFRHQQLLHLDFREAPVELSETMEGLEEKLKRHGFLRIHKSFLVNYRFIQRLEKNEVMLSSGLALPVGRSKQKELQEAYQELCRMDHRMLR